MPNDNHPKTKKKCNIETGFLEYGLPFARIGNGDKILINIEALSYKNEPPSGFLLKQIIKSFESFMDDYTIYHVGRKQNLPEGYLFDKMADDYAVMIRSEFKGHVDVMGASTGGQIAHYLAANHPDVVRKLVIVSAAYRISEKGAEIERKAEEYFKEGKIGKSLAASMDLVFSSKIKRRIAKFFISLIGKKIMGELKYPNDFLNEIQADREMNFINRLGEIKAPTLVISGELDICYVVEDVRATAEGIPNAELIIYNGYGHNLTISNRDQVYKDILKFLNS